jgi:hypothetical protein
MAHVFSLASIQLRQVNHLQNLASVIERLEKLVHKELTQPCFTSEDERFIESLMEEEF